MILVILTMTLVILTIMVLGIKTGCVRIDVRLGLAIVEVFDVRHLGFSVRINLVCVITVISKALNVSYKRLGCVYLKRQLPKFVATFLALHLCGDTACVRRLVSWPLYHWPVATATLVAGFMSHRYPSRRLNQQGFSVRWWMILA